MDGGVAALLGADRPRAAGIVGASLERVVLSLAIRPPDRVDRRQVDDVEPEVGQLGQEGLEAREAAPGAREQLVPRTERGELTVDVDLERGAPRLLGAV